MPESETQAATCDTERDVSLSKSLQGNVVFVLLSSSMIRQPFALATPLHLLDFEIASKTTLFQHWASIIPDSYNTCPTEIRVMLAPEAPAPTSVQETNRIRILRDRDGYRGPAGALIDACEDLPENTLIVVLESTRVLFANLMPMIASHIDRAHDVTVVTSATDQPVGVTITHRAMLDSIPRRGYIDLKEQWLAQHIKKNARVFAHRVPLGSSLQIRNRASLLAAMAQLSRMQHNTRSIPSVKISSSRFVMRALDGHGVMHSDGTAISNHASAPGSYIMAGANVPSSAVLARCIVFPGARVHEEEMLQDLLIGPNGRVTDDQFLLARRRGGRA
ncbi:MAG: hypothetical protein H6815_11155 [Phycisphaeraceae bacterium]|nr:hypothetical protein [Phycisphaerales bacterium]MCB9860994.1 hypothetical protein [Phycisphaeraceae bacterium]